MEKIAYIILHYQALEETLQCVDSIKRRHGDGKCYIIVVDNGSPNASGLKLQEQFYRDEEVFVILSERNLGFAKGLNKGIEYARTVINCDFCVLLNNDTELINDNWDRRIASKYNDYKFAVLGPDIISLDNVHTNPSDSQDTSISGIKKMISKKKLDYVMYSIYVKPVWINIKKFIKRTVRYKNSSSKSVNTDTIGVQLQGSCLILSPIYFRHYTELYNKTFLYFEEAILKYRCDKHGLISLYSPDLVILHKESVSVNQVAKNSRNKQLFYLKHSMHSCEEFLQDCISGKE